jgi:hypothetical protein
MKYLNDNFELCSETYYFSIAASTQSTNRCKERFRLTDTEKITKMAIGYDINVNQNLKYTGEAKKLHKKPRAKVSLFNKILTTLKVAANAVSINNKVFYEN